MNLLRDLAQLYLIQKANPFHAADGRFTSASGRGSSKATYVSTEADPRIQSRNSLYYKSFGKSIARNERKTGKSHTVDGEENWTSKHYNSKRSGIVNPYGHENPKLLTNEMIKQHGSKSKAARAILKDYEENVPKKIRDDNQRDVNRSERASHYRTKKSELLSRLVYLYS